jgi:EAL domain-containing protein (putative c-di-GMP-specific phosphodiesterase class I)
VTAVCEGVETAGELQLLTELGVDLIQGYYIARPTFEGLSPIPTALAA